MPTDELPGASLTAPAGDNGGNRGQAKGHDAVSAACARAYRAAGIEPGGRGPVAPLAALLRAHSLIFEEIDELCRRTAADHLRRSAGLDLSDDGEAHEPLAGYLYANTYGGWILVNRGDLLARRRFSAAHELGHYLLHYLPLLDRQGEDTEQGPPEYEELLPLAGDEGDSPLGRAAATFAQQEPDPEAREAEANRFAAETLLPAVAVRALAEQLRAGGVREDGLARRLGSEMLVSRAAAARRLRDLGLW